MRLEKLSCRRRVALLLDYLDANLPPAQRRVLARHRLSCRSCDGLLASLRRTVRTLRALKRGAKPPETARRALSAALKRAG